MADRIRQLPLPPLEITHDSALEGITLKVNEIVAALNDVKYKGRDGTELMLTRHAKRQQKYAAGEPVFIPIPDSRPWWLRWLR